MGADQSMPQQPPMARSAPMTPLGGPHHQNSGGKAPDFYMKQSTSVNVMTTKASMMSPAAASDLAPPDDAMRRRTKSESRHFADFSLFPDRYDSGSADQRRNSSGGGNAAASMNKSATTDAFRQPSATESVAKGLLGLK